MDENRAGLPVAVIEIEVRDKDGKLIEKRKQPARSWVKNMIIYLRSYFAYADANVVKQDGTTTTNRVTAMCAEIFPVNAGTGEDRYGLLVGTGTKVFSIDDYSLDNKIPHGTSSGQLSYGETTVEGIVDDGSKLSFKIVRTFSNESGADIVVTEIGLAVRGGDNYILIARDLLDPSVTVPNGKTLTVRYIIQYVYA